ncbi:DUF2062 domain-containing protein [Paenibacillus frigoriresistens]|uniref:DUF2062 domain-containing protein n=1 Tax=Paenibacillus alginolyticus TaxID=59839 RepID=UPI0015634F56|nr:DUF2062 domain-containing protein [Paenibacillus frigoriresistens]NRF93075.1 DUF2062 domain-containing protein [Paenibacillus frigoriresistens]
MKNFITKLKTKIASKWHELLNDPAGPHLVAMSFAIGVISEMLTIPTVGIAFVLMIVIVKKVSFSMTSALVGYFFTKIVYIPLAPLELMIGKTLLHENFDPHAHKWAWARGVLHKDAELLLGAVIIGGVLAVICYFVIRQILVLRLKRTPKTKLS